MLGYTPLDLFLADIRDMSLAALGKERVVSGGKLGMHRIVERFVTYDYLEILRTLQTTG